MLKKHVLLALVTSVLLTSSHALLAEEDSYEREADTVADTVYRPNPVDDKDANSAAPVMQQQNQMMNTQQRNMQTAPAPQQMNQQQMQQQAR